MKMVPSPNFNDRRQVVVPDMLVLHYTGMETCEAARQRLCDPAAEVSAHYLVDEDGAVYGLVDEDKRAWHAGVSSWRDFTDINSRSIGIELVNPGHEFGYRDFPDAQIVALIELCQGILGRHAIPARNVVGHSDIAPARKMDPGESFPWQRLADQGIGLWPDPDPMNAGDPLIQLQEIGYAVDDVDATVRAFQRRFCPEPIDGLLEGETAKLVARVHSKFTGSI